VITDTLPAVNPEPEAAPAAPSVRRRRLIVLGVVLALIVGSVAARAWWPDRGEDVRSGTTLVDAEGMADRYGIDVTLVAVSAAGGMIDFRYQVVDPEKADGVLHDDTLLPILVREDTGETLILSSPPHHHATVLELGATYFFLFANAHNAIHDGTLVTLVLGDVRLEHIVAQG
jgi:hypothetical protein